MCEMDLSGFKPRKTVKRHHSKKVKENVKPLLNIFTFDLECTSKEPAHCYMGAINRVGNTDLNKVDIIYSPNHERTIGKVVAELFNLPNNSIVYAHNLTYDLSFILSYLFQNYVSGVDFVIENHITIAMTKNNIMAVITFNGRKITFRDSFVLFSAPLKDVMKWFTEFEKGETPIYDYLYDVVIDDYCIEYCKMDAMGLGLAIEKRMAYGTDKQGRIKLTTASGAMSEFKKTCPSFSDFFPTLYLNVDKEMRPAYRGGFTYLNPIFKDVKLLCVKVIDVNSMYPSVMYNRLLPVGKPREIRKGEVEINPHLELGIQKFKCAYAEIKDSYVPFLSMSNGFNGVNVYEDVLEDFEMSLTIQEFNMFKRSYHIEGLVLLGGWSFKGRKGLFREYIDKFWEMKMSDNPIEKAIGKLFLNALYGKFAQAREVQNFNFNYEEKLVYEEVEITPLFVGYLPMGIFITSYSRLKLINAILKIGMKNFVYCDTDSIHYINDVDHDLEMHPDDIGAWDFEKEFSEAKYLGSKRYVGLTKYKEGKNGKKGTEPYLSFACAGISKKALAEQVTCVDDFKIGRQIKVQQASTGVNGKYFKDKLIKI